MEYPSELWAEARRLFEVEGQDVAVIAEMLDVHPTTVYGRARQEQWSRPLNYRGKRPLTGVGTARRRRMTARLFAAFERQVRDMEARLAGLDGREADDRDARTLATLAQTLDRLVGLDASINAPDDGEAPDDEPDIDAFRRDLARRLEAIRSASHRGPAGEPEPGGD
ncbi:hypothetical protein [Breoghania sp. L-A4]|uniref:hypothetical protein n=1 Tax=Breoghania sp. L-A4 TaxID=2304600 RepID=UPI000E359509|nr:hypothetical protein [Breoghania sp. L-A4]AXS39953.1 hypothetical protein D1F64_07635 [Breoghania sp. L-A4]